MFSVTEVATPRGTLQYRYEHYSGFRCRISPDRLKRKIDQTPFIPPLTEPCPFCPEQVFHVTPAFADGSRIVRGESVTFPNMYPFSEGHVVTVITREHSVHAFSRNQLVDAFRGAAEALLPARGYASINWNYLPSAGASVLHPHMQGIADHQPTYLVEQYLSASRKYKEKTGGIYWDVIKEEDRASERYLFGDEIVWSAHAVPLGEREVRAILPVSTLDEVNDYVDLLSRGILEVLALYKKLGTHAFNLALFFDNGTHTGEFTAFCSMISRINPNPTSACDSAFMERMHIEPVILTLPEDLGNFYRKEK